MSKTVGNFTFVETSIKDVFIIEPKKYGDNRGYFMETYKESDFIQAGLNYKFIQDNQSKSKKGVLRGLHFQKTHPLFPKNAPLFGFCVATNEKLSCF